MSFQCTVFCFPPDPLPNPRLEETSPKVFCEVTYENEPIFIPRRQLSNLVPVIDVCPRCLRRYAARRGHSCPVVTIAGLPAVE